MSPSPSPPPPSKKKVPLFRLSLVIVLASSCSADPPQLGNVEQSVVTECSLLPPPRTNRLRNILDWAKDEWQKLRPNKVFVPKHAQAHYQPKFLDTELTPGAPLPDWLPHRDNLEWVGDQLLVKSGPEAGKRAYKPRHAIWNANFVNDPQKINHLYTSILGQMSEKIRVHIKKKGGLETMQDALNFGTVIWHSGDDLANGLLGTTYELVARDLTQSRIGGGITLSITLRRPDKAPIAHYLDNTSGTLVKSDSYEATIVMAIDQNGMVFSKTKTAYGGFLAGISVAVASALSAAAAPTAIAPEDGGGISQPLLLPELEQGIANEDAEALAIANELTRLTEMYEDALAQAALEQAQLEQASTQTLQESLPVLLVELFAPLWATDATLGLSSVPARHPMAFRITEDGRDQLTVWHEDLMNLSRRLVAFTGRDPQDQCEVEIAKLELSEVVTILAADAQAAAVTRSELGLADVAELFREPEAPACHEYRWSGNLIDGTGQIYYRELPPVAESGLAYSLTWDSRPMSAIPDNCEAFIENLLETDRQFAGSTEKIFGGIMTVCGTPSETLECVRGYVEGIRKLEVLGMEFESTNSDGRTGGPGEPPIAPGTSYNSDWLDGHVPIPYHGSGSVGVIGGGPSPTPTPIPTQTGGCSLYSGNIPSICLDEGKAAVDPNTGEVAAGDSFDCAGFTYVCAGNGAWVVEQ